MWVGGYALLLLLLAVPFLAGCAALPAAVPFPVPPYESAEELLVRRHEVPWRLLACAPAAKGPSHDSICTVNHGASKVRKPLAPPMLLMVVRHGDSDAFRRLRRTFAGQPVWIVWDRRVRERRDPHRRIPGDRRRGDRRDGASPLTLNRLPFIALALPAARYRRGW
jgi:hypothetical protein